jgi:glycoside hydrolase family 25
VIFNDPHKSKKTRTSQARSKTKRTSVSAPASKHRRHVMHTLEEKSQNNPVVKWGLITLAIVFTLALLQSCQGLFSLSFDNNLIIKNQVPYEWENLSYDAQGRAHYIVDGKELTSTGVDVSSHQGYIDWEAVAADNIQFAMLRIGYRGSTEGGIRADELFETNLKGAQNAGLKVGVYFFSQAITVEEAREEANFVLQQLREAGITELELPVAFDLEPSPDYSGRADNLSPAETNAIARAFCTTIQEAGYRVIVYGNKVDLNRFDLVSLNEPIWLAQYVDEPDVNFNFLIWQYTSTGQVDGITGSVDLNLDFSNVSSSKNPQ